MGCKHAGPCHPSHRNCLLDPTLQAGNTIFVEGIREETLVSAEHALQIIAAGNEQRKVRACMCVCVRVAARPAGGQPAVASPAG